MKYQAPYGVTDPNAPYINGNPATGVQGSIPPAAAFEQPLRELDSLIKAAQFTPADSDLQQVARSVRQGVNYIDATNVGGNVNALAAVNPTNVPPLAQYKIGLRLDLRIPANNTGAVTLAIDSLPAVQVVRCNGAALAADDLVAGMVVELIYDGTRFQIVNFRGVTSTTTNNNNFVVNLPYVADTSPNVNAIVAPFAPAITTVTPGEAILVKLAHTLTGASTIQVNALAAAPVVRPNGQPTQLNDAWIGEILLLLYDGTKWQICNSIGLPQAYLSANADWYVNAISGNDSYDGTAATGTGPHGPFRTMMRAVNETYKYNMNGYSQTIHVANGTYNETVQCGQTNGVGTVFITGNSGAPDNCVIQGGLGRSAIGFGGGHWSLDGFALVPGAAPALAGEPRCCCSVDQPGTTVTVQNLSLYAGDNGHIEVSHGAAAYLYGNFYVHGGARWCLVAGSNGQLGVSNIPSQWPNIDCLGLAVAFQDSFIGCGLMGYTQVTFNSILNAGSVQGKKFHVYANSILNSQTDGGGGPDLSYYPGNLPGLAENATGGYYV